jgi:TM2 domain-containing membrane protein YozV
VGSTVSALGPTRRQHPFHRFCHRHGGAGHRVPLRTGLGTPTALMVGSGMGAENGILIRNGEAVQTFKELKMVIFDKTGTITYGKPAVTDFKR